MDNFCITTMPEYKPFTQHCDKHQEKESGPLVARIKLLIPGAILIGICIFYLSLADAESPTVNDRYVTTVNTDPKIVGEIELPTGYARVTPKNDFGRWLRNLPLKSSGAEVHLYDGRLKTNQSAHYRVIDLPIIGTKDLHQCADAIIRLRAQFLYAHKKYDQITFNFTSGDPAPYRKWAQGYRPVISRTVRWKKTRIEDYSEANFYKYLETVFMYAGTHSLQKELHQVRPSNIKIGDVFIQGGFPGHAVIVVDMAVHKSKKIFLLAQSYMPAQEIHVLNNVKESVPNPWYLAGDFSSLETPEWVFTWKQLASF